MAKFGLVGKTLKHSFSAQHFNAKFERERLPYSYHNFELEQIEDFPKLLREHPDLVGLNVTIPYKERILPYVDVLHEDAKKIGAVNTLCKENGRWVGYNTDVYGFVHSIKHLLNNRKRALILGSGGASKAVAAGLDILEITYHFVSRTPGDGLVSYEQASEWLEAFPIVINTTPVGQFPNTGEKPPLSLEGMTENHLIYDLIYNPEKTAFLKEAKARKGVYKNGLDMLYLQAEKAWEIWTKNM